MSVTIKLRAIRDANPCSDRWEKQALAALGGVIDDREVTFAQIIQASGRDAALFCLRCLSEADQWRVRLFARSCAAHVLHLWNAPEDVRYFLRTGSNHRAAYAAAFGVAYAAAAAYTERKWQMAELVRIMDLPDTPESRILDMPERSAK